MYNRQETLHQVTIWLETGITFSLAVCSELEIVFNIRRTYNVSQVGIIEYLVYHVRVRHKDVGSASN